MAINTERANEVIETLRLALAEQAVTLAAEERRVDADLRDYIERTGTR